MHHTCLYNRLYDKQGDVMISCFFQRSMPPPIDPPGCSELNSSSRLMRSMGESVCISSKVLQCVSNLDHLSQVLAKRLPLTPLTSPNYPFPNSLCSLWAVFNENHRLRPPLPFEILRTHVLMSYQNLQIVSFVITVVCTMLTSQPPQTKKKLAPKRNLGSIHLGSPLQKL